jgi:hypothetical protein
LAVADQFNILDSGLSVPKASLMKQTAAIAETYPRWMTMTSAGYLTSGQQSFVAIWLDAGVTVSTITFFAGGTAAVTPTAQWFSLYNSARGKLAVTADDTTTAWAAFATKTLTLSAPYVTTYAGLHYLGIMVAAATVPTIAGMTPFGTAAALAAPPVSGKDSTNTGLTTPATAPTTAAAFAGLSAFAWAWVA